MKYLGVEEITTPRQQVNGTREFAIPFYMRGKRVTLASYQSGYVRIDRNCYTIYQINPTYEAPYKFINKAGELKSWTNKKRMMIYGEKTVLTLYLTTLLKTITAKTNGKDTNK